MFVIRTVYSTVLVLFYLIYDIFVALRSQASTDLEWREETDSGG